MSYQVNWELNGVYVRFDGVFDGRSNNAANEEIYSDPRVDNIDFQIWDLTEIDGIDIDEDDIEYAAGMDCSAASSHVRNIKLALITNEKDEFSTQACLHYIEAVTACEISWDIKLFHDLESARNWVISKKAI